MKIQHPHQSKMRPRFGATAVEFAMTLPLLFLFLFACYEMGRANMLVHATESAAYEAARVGIVPGATPDEIRNAAEFILASVGVRDFTIDVSPDVITNETERVRVDIAVPFETNNMNIPQMFVGDPTFRGSCELSRETL